LHSKFLAIFKSFLLIRKSPDPCGHLVLLPLSTNYCQKCTLEARIFINSIPSNPMTQKHAFSKEHNHFKNPVQTPRLSSRGPARLGLIQASHFSATE